MFKSFSAAVLLALAGTATANAGLVYPVSFFGADQNGTTVAADRSNPANALGATDGVFYSLGLGGSLVLDFGQRVGGTGVITEVTFDTAGYEEYANLFTSTDGVTWAALSTSFNGLAVAGEEITAPSAFRYLKFVDASPTGKNRDGFDIDSVGFAPVPLPAAGVVLAGGLGALAMLRRRRS